MQLDCQFMGLELTAVFVSQGKEKHSLFSGQWKTTAARVQTNQAKCPERAGTLQSQEK